MKIMILLLLLSATFMSCNNKTEYVPVQGNWIKGTEQEKLKTIESQFRGFDKTMVEVGYRYQELYWGGQDENWEYAQYQLEKIDKTIKQGLQRRPKRAQSAQHFLSSVIPEMENAIVAKDTSLFNKKFEMMRVNCISCHAMERVPTFFVRIPTDRQSPIGKQ